MRGESRKKCFRRVAYFAWIDGISNPQQCKWEHVWSNLELGGTQILGTVRYFIKYLSINNYYGILINTFMYPVKYSNNFSQVYKSSVKNQKQAEN